MIWLRALRLPFLAASLLPFGVGALLAGGRWDWPSFLLGLGAVAATHLSANLINDFADSRNGADWQDLTYNQGFFGGSKLIQEGRLAEGWFRRAAQLCGIVAALLVAGLAVVMHSGLPLVAFAVILALAWAYSQPPLQLACRGLGEPVIFLLFGPALVMGGSFTRNGVFPTAESFLLSLPFGFLTTAILVANEVPDYAGDCRAGKRNWVHMVGPRQSYRLHGGLIAATALSLAVCMGCGVLGAPAICSVATLLPAAYATVLLKTGYEDRGRLLQASKLTIGAHALTSLLLLFTVGL